MLARIAFAVLLLLSFDANFAADAHVIWLEAEQFDETGGWSNDSQHVDIMGSPYLLATGVGKPVADAVTTVPIPRTDRYRLWVRCRDWLPEYAPGQFQVIVGGATLETTFGKQASDAWQWVDGGTRDLQAGEVEIRLHDLTGWWGRCDAVVLATEGFKPAEGLNALAEQRVAHCGVTPEIKPMGNYDVVVVGGGPAGLGASLAAARHGSKVALVQDRPVLGGNASSEIEVPPMGYIGSPPDKVNVTGIAEEIFPPQGWNNYADSKGIQEIVEAEENISLYLNTRATDVEMQSETHIQSVLAIDVRTGQRMSFAAPLFIDCTGHGWIGYYAGAEFRMGQEARDEFGESLAPVEAGKRTMGNSLYKAVFRDHRPPTVPGQIVRYDDRDKVTQTGSWSHSTFHGGDYLQDGNDGKGEKQIVFSMSVEEAGTYEVFLGYLPWENRASAVPVTIEHADGTSSVTVDQRSNDQGWKRLGAFRLSPDRPARVTVSNADTDGYVVAESVRYVRQGDNFVAKTPSPVPFDCPPWAYQWRSSSDFEGLGTHRRIKDIVRPENFDRSSRGTGRNPGNDINGAISHAWWVEYGGMLDTIQDAEKIRDELFRISIGLWNYAKNHNPATIERNKYRELVWLNYVPGVRESRRLVGDYIMQQRDYDEQTVHTDTVAFTDWGSDVHHPEGYWVRGNDCIHVYGGRRVSIPYRTLYSKNIDNLFMAGRCHSATHIAMGGTRVMRPMCATGQAAGTAAAIARQYATTPRGIYEHHVSELQQELLKDGCYLIGVGNGDFDDLALRANVTASSESLETPAINVINGWNRIVDGNRNAWAPAQDATGPQWIQLELSKPEEINTVHVTFERQCTDCSIQVYERQDWTTVAKIAEGQKRRIVCEFAPVVTDKVRLLFDERSHNAAICEVRIYCSGNAQDR